MEERKVSVSPLLGGITLTSQLKSPTLVLLPPIQTIKRLADHLSHSIDWIECVTYSRSDLFVFSGGDHSDFESLAQQPGGRGIPGQGDNRGAFLLKTYLPSNVNLKFQIWYITILQRCLTPGLRWTAGHPSPWPASLPPTERFLPSYVIHGDYSL